MIQECLCRVYFSSCFTMLEIFTVTPKFKRKVRVRWDRVLCLICFSAWHHRRKCFSKLCNQSGSFPSRNENSNRIFCLTSCTRPSLRIASRRILQEYSTKLVFFRHWCNNVTAGLGKFLLSPGRENLFFVIDEKALVCPILLTTATVSHRFFLFLFTHRMHARTHRRLRLRVPSVLCDLYSAGEIASWQPASQKPCIKKDGERQRHEAKRIQGTKEEERSQERPSKAEVPREQHDKECRFY